MGLNFNHIQVKLVLVRFLFIFKIVYNYDYGELQSNIQINANLITKDKSKTD